ncbi:hypothetical protein [Streptomyces sp. OR43]|uniref:hypothetical protein n=1 Tax=Streptomyces sp. or43 TaxID=2478957 RepID=UPI0011CE7F29|nr:hypothetical protein [Streptomyces sp. or43]TXS35731.1 hypothetical protein EAO72_19120 [Streptomyces sp. or43]
MSDSQLTMNDSFIGLLSRQHIADVEAHLVQQGFRVGEQAVTHVPLTFTGRSPLAPPLPLPVPLTVVSIGHAQNSARWNR